MADAARARPRVEFHVHPRLALGTRWALVGALLTAGIACQLLVAWWLGVPLVFYGVLTSLCKGVSNKSRVRGKARWEAATIEELRRAKDLCRRTKEWASDAYSLSATPSVGCALFLLLVGLVVGLAVWLHSRGEGNLRNAVIADGAVMFLLLYATGGREGWQPENLHVKLEPLLHVMDDLERHPDPTVDVRPMLEVRGTAERAIPRDCKLMLKIRGAPDSFYGVQVQASINSVQGTAYPYLYCVLLATPGSGLVALVEPLLTEPVGELGFLASKNDKKNPDRHKKRYRDEVAEPQTRRGAELVVIRQVTLRRGFHTKPDDQIRVVRAALELANRILPQLRTV